jgi:integrase
MMATIRKKRNKWQCIIRLKSVQQYKTFTSKALASAYAKKVETDIINGTYEDNSELVKIKLSHLMDLYFDHTRHDTEYPSRLNDEINKIKRYPISNIALGYLTGQHCAIFRDTLLKEELAKSTVRRYLGLIQRILDVGRKELAIPLSHNPMMLISKPREDDSRDRVLTDNEWARVLEECEKSSVYWLKAFVEIARETICRRSEIFQLTRQSINFDNNTAYLGKTKNGSPRRIALSPYVISILKSLPVSVDGKYFKTPFKSEKNVKHLASRAFARCVKKAQVENFRLHDIRHMSASDYAMKGWTISELSAQGGWKSLSQLKRYTHVRADYLAEKMRGY